MKQFTQKRSIQILGHILSSYDIKNIIISPGSRNAPLAIHFSEIPKFNCYSIVDERSAAFVALGMAKCLKQPVAVVCTSGSAATNYYPAVTEAFYQNIPILLLTADRPTDFVDLFDGQTIRQKNLFQQHSYGDFELSEDGSENAEEYNWNTAKNAIECCIEKQGPVHINIPLAEPLYQITNELPVFPVVENTISLRNFELQREAISDWNAAKRIMILVGSTDGNPTLEMQLSQLVKNHSVVVLTETNSNLHNEKFFSHIDRYIFNFSEKDYLQFAPDLLITIGQNVISKKVKQFLRKALPTKHWHIDPFWQPDTYFSLSSRIETQPHLFFHKLLQNIQLNPSPYYNLWEVLRNKKDNKHFEYLKKIGFSDFYSIHLLSQKIPENYIIHFGNSTAIRYAQLFDFKHKTHCNRGTSGIDGCTSTAMGYAMVSEQPIILISGDIGFMYDINGLWNNYIPPYTRIVVLNNGGGDIFKIIPGPSDISGNMEELVYTTHHKKLEFIAKHFDFDYSIAYDEDDLERILNHFFKPSTKPKILEINTQKIDNSQILKDYFQFLCD